MNGFHYADNHKPQTDTYGNSVD